MNNNIIYEKTDILNSRSYANYFEIAKNAFKTIEKINEYRKMSDAQNDLIDFEFSDIKYIFFDNYQLRMICTDYLFAALENFLEHIGFILFNDWDSKKKQRYYQDKLQKNSSLSEVINKNIQPNLNYESIEEEWYKIINSLNFADYAAKRNPIKHIHTEKHDIKTQITQSNNIQMHLPDFDTLVRDTNLDFTDEQCKLFLQDVENYIKNVHEFIARNKLLFWIYGCTIANEKIGKRKMLFDTFLINPFAQTIYSSSLRAM